MGWREDIGQFIFPPHCVQCKTQVAHKNQIYCLTCYESLPKTNHFDLKTNDLFLRFKSDGYQLNYMATLFYYDKNSPLQKAIKLLKYKHKTDVAYFFGIQLGKKAVNMETFLNADYVIPLPLFPKKQKLRGYNQSDYIAQGISSVLKVPLEIEGVKRVRDTKTQTKKNKADRKLNMEKAFCWVKEYPENTHFIIVDDVITTGASIESLIDACDNRYIFSVLCIGFAR